MRASADVDQAEEEVEMANEPAQIALLTLPNRKFCNFAQQKIALVQVVERHFISFMPCVP